MNTYVYVVTFAWAGDSLRLPLRFVTVFRESPVFAAAFTKHSSYRLIGIKTELWLLADFDPGSLTGVKSRVKTTTFLHIKLDRFIVLVFNSVSSSSSRMLTDPPRVLEISQNGSEATPNLSDYILVAKSQTVQPVSKAVSSAELSCSSAGDLLAAKSRLTAVPSGMVEGGFIRHKGKKGKKQSHSKVFNCVGGRPAMSRVKLTPSITVMLSVTQATLFASSTTVPVYLGDYLTLSSFSNYTEYTSLFDQYKIEEIWAWCEPNQSQSTVSAGTGQLTSAIDLDDANTPTSIAGVQDKQGSITSSTYAGHFHNWKPHMAVAVYSGAFTSFANAPAGWIDCASPGVQHYGLKFAVTTTAAVEGFTVNFRAKVSFRCPGL